MGRNFLLFVCLLILIVLGSCSTPAGRSAVPTTVPPTDVTSTSPLAQVPIASASDLPASTLVTEPMDMQATAVFPSVPPPDPSYDECSQGRDAVLGSWALCDPMTDPITLISVSNDIRHFSYKDYYGQEIPNPCTSLHHITGDGKYLYFSLDEDCILTEPGFIPSISLFRMDLTNGQVVETLPASYNFESYEGDTYSISISPTGRRLAYLANHSPMALNILDLQTGQSNTYQLDKKYLDGGSFTWSQDGTQLVFMLSSKENYDLFISMEYLDVLNSNSLVTFVKDQIFEWIVSNIEITPAGIQISPPGEEALFYKFDTGILSPIK